MLFYARDTGSGFNSSKVRLGGTGTVGRGPPDLCFNSSKVRLGAESVFWFVFRTNKFQFL